MSFVARDRSATLAWSSALTVASSSLTDCSSSLEVSSSSFVDCSSSLMDCISSLADLSSSLEVSSSSLADLEVLVLGLQLLQERRLLGFGGRGLAALRPGLAGVGLRRRLRLPLRKRLEDDQEQGRLAADRSAGCTVTPDRG